MRGGDNQALNESYSSRRLSLRSGGGSGGGSGRTSRKGRRRDSQGPIKCHGVEFHASSAKTEARRKNKRDGGVWYVFVVQLLGLVVLCLFGSLSHTRRC